jgi:Sec-independent protein translocase protein TatA
MLFGAERLQNVGGNLGSCIKDFRRSFKDKDAIDDKSEITMIEKVGLQEGLLR